MKKISLVLAILSLTFVVNAQRIGDWMAHTPGLKVIDVDVMHDEIYAATPSDIFYYDLKDNSINHLTKVNGLSDMGISLMRYCESVDVMFVGYTNTNIDIIDSQGEVTNIPDIYNKYILGNKTINNVFFNDKFAYVCCGFGIVVIDLKRNEVNDTYFFRNGDNYLGVNDVTICDSVFYAATEIGIFYAETSNNFLADFSQWKHFNHDLPHKDENFSHIENFNGEVLAIYSDNENWLDNIFAISDTTTWRIYIQWPGLVNDMRVCGGTRLVLTENNNRLRVYNTYKTLVFSYEDNEYDAIRPYTALLDRKRDCYWVGTRSESLVKITPISETESYHESIPFNGPYSSNSFSITALGKDIWVAAGGYDAAWAKTWYKDGFSHYDGDRWDYFNEASLPEAFESVTDIVEVKPDPRNKNIIYAASYGSGLMVFENGKFKIRYDHKNSPLSSHSSDTTHTFVSGFDFDKNHNMWIVTRGTDSLCEWKADGTWRTFKFVNDDIGHLMVDDNDIKWILKRDGDILAFHDGIYKTVNDGDNTGALPGDANCFVTDNDGTVWIGTTDGVALFYNSNRIFNYNTYVCSRILIPRNDGSGQADYLLSGLSVLAIAADGANNMWFGTNNGVIQTSNDGQTTYHHFTMENSPLFSNKVTDIAIDDDGVVYFTTDKGVISYRGSATKGNENNDNVVVFPNPVRPEHSGTIGIKGVVTNALIKITTTNGAFVTHLRAEGGQAIWDRTDIHGNTVSPGIYLIFITDDAGNETYATKVLIMK